jgi:hypothetical protein
MTIVFELVGGALEVTVDGEGVATLRRVLDRIEIRGHEHLATPAWAGTELTDPRFFDHSTVVHQVTFTRKPDDSS